MIRVIRRAVFLVRNGRRSWSEDGDSHCRDVVRTSGGDDEGTTRLRRDLLKSLTQVSRAFQLIVSYRGRYDHVMER
jgi:hypothetical protein